MPSVTIVLLRPAQGPGSFVPDNNSEMKTRYTLLVLVTSVMVAAKAQTPIPASIFGTNGCTDIPFPGINGAFKSHALQPDGELLLAGWGTGGTFYACMARIDTACGELDPSFGQNGVLTHHFEQRTICNSIALQADGKIVGGGLIAASNAGSGQFPGVWRYNADGSVDNTFNGSGYNNIGFSTGSAVGEVEEVFIDADGRILAAIMGNAQIGVFRYLPDGTLDPDYASDGRAEMSVGYTPFTDNLGAVMDPDGSVTMAALVGTSPFEPYFMALARFLPDGDPDPDFGTNGLALHPTVPTTAGTADGAKDWSIVRRPGGGYLVGYGVQLGVTSPSVAAFLEDGAIDQTFGTDGIYHFTDENAAGSGLWMEADGSALLFLKHNSNSGPGAIVKLTPSGERDASFGNNGLLLVPFGAPQDGRGFVHGFRLPGGDLMAYGSNSNTGQGSVVRFSLDVEENALPVISYEFPDLIVSGGGSAQWFLDGAPINGATTSSYTPTQNGTYTVEMNSFGCVNTSPPFQFLSTGLSDMQDHGIAIRQEMAAGLLFVTNDGADMPWHVLDASGREMQHGQLRTGTNEVPLDNLRSGLYLLRAGRHVHRFVMP